MSSREKSKNRANLYNNAPGYSDMNSYNPRSQTTMSQAHYDIPRDSRIVADKVKKIPIHMDEISRQWALNDADPVRYYKTMNAFKPFNVYLDFSHSNAYETTADAVYKYDFTRSKVRSGNTDKDVVTSAVIKLESGNLSMPRYLLDPLNYTDMSELFVYFMNIPVAYSNGKFPYHFKYYPTQTLQISDPAKQLYLPESIEFNMTIPQALDTYEMVIRDKAGNILVPEPNKKGILFSGNPTIITSPAHGLIGAGFYITQINMINLTTPVAIKRYYPITVIDADNFSFPVDTSNILYINDKPVEYLIDNYNFELNIKALNINWDEEHTFSGRK
jgi:hypothetical protein